MTSKISYYKIALEDLRRRIWMLALSCLGNVLALPVTFLIMNHDYLEIIERSQETGEMIALFQRYYTRYLTNYGLYCVAFVAIVGALIVSIFGFRYLYSRKMTDLYHAIPIKRGRMFLIIYLNGLLLFLIPLLLSTLILLVLFFVNLASHGALAVFGTLLWATCRMLFLSVVNFLTVYHLGLVCVMLSGNAFNALCLTGLFGTAVAAVFALFEMLSSSFLDTFHSMGISWEQIIWASPLISPFFLLSDHSSGASGLFLTGLNASQFQHPYLPRIGTLLVMAANLLIAYRLYLKRPSETAEHGVDRPVAQSLVRIAASLIAGLFGGYMFLMIMDKEAIGWHLFGVLLCGCLVFGVADIILHMNFHSFFAHKKQMLFSLLGTCTLVLILAFDLTGYDHRLPAKEVITDARISLNYYTDESPNYRFTEAGNIIPDYDYNRTIPYTDLDLLYPLLERMTDDQHEAPEQWSYTFHVMLETSVGPFEIPFRRTYRILEEDLDVVRPIIESQEYLEACYTASLGLLPAPASMAVGSDLVHTEEYLADAGLIRRIRDAYAADFTNHTSMEYLENGLAVGTIDLQYPYVEDDYTHLYSLHLPVFDYYTETISILQEEFPHLALQKQDLEFTSLEISSSKLSFFGLSEQETVQEDYKVISENVTVTQTIAVPEYLNDFTIDDPEELAALLPYLLVGDYHSGNFQALERYQYIGRLTTTKGHSIACYAKKDSLPLPVPASLLEALEN